MTDKQVVQGGFVVGRPDDSTTPNRVKKLAKVDTYLIQYTDKEGKDQVQLAFHVPGTDSVSLLKQQVQGQKIAAPATDWLTRQLVEMINKPLAGKAGQI